MGESKTIVFEYEEVITALIKQQGIHEGVWALYLQFGLQVGNINVGSPEGKQVPGVIIPIMQIGIEKTSEKATGIFVDAAKVNPSSKP